MERCVNTLCGNKLDLLILGCLVSGIIIMQITGISYINQILSYRMHIGLWCISTIICAIGVLLLGLSNYKN